MRLYNERKKRKLIPLTVLRNANTGCDLTTTTGCKTHFIWVGMKNYKSFRGLYLLGIFRRLSKCHCKTTKRRGHSMNSTARRSLKRHGFIMEQEFGGKHRWFYKPEGGGIFSRYFQLPPTALTTTFALIRAVQMISIDCLSQIITTEKACCSCITEHTMAHSSNR